VELLGGAAADQLEIVAQRAQSVGAQLAGHERFERCAG
jgi:hypothetical protein